MLEGSGSLQPALLSIINTSGSSVEVENLAFQNVSAFNDGGGIRLRGGSATLNNCVFDNCRSPSSGGAIDSDGSGSLNIDSCRFIENSTGTYGGAISAAGGDVRIQNSAFLSNRSEGGAFNGAGGAIVFSSGSLELIGCTFLGNEAANRGGAILAWIYGNVTARDCLFSGNTVLASQGEGGAISVDFASSLTLNQCQVSENHVLDTSSARGAGIWIDSTSQASAMNTTICSNTPVQVIGVLDDEGGNCIEESCDDCTSQLSVCSSGADFTSIQAAIDSINPNSQFITQIYVCDETFVESIDFQGKTIELIGETDASGAPTTVIDAGGAGRVLTIDGQSGPDVRVENLILQNGLADEGGGILLANGVAPSFKNCIIRDCHAIHGGGCRVGFEGQTYPGNGEFESCMFIGNSSVLTGSAIDVQDGTLRIFDSYIGCNSSTDETDSAAIYINGQLQSVSTVLVNTRVCNNTPTQILGSYSDGGGNTICSDCIGDLTGDGQVGGADITIVLGNWGVCEDPFDCPADLNCDGQVNGADLTYILGNWGVCP